MSAAASLIAKARGRPARTPASAKASIIPKAISRATTGNSRNCFNSTLQQIQFHPRQPKIFFASTFISSVTNLIATNGGHTLHQQPAVFGMVLITGQPGAYLCSCSIEILLIMDSTPSTAFFIAPIKSSVS